MTPENGNQNDPENSENRQTQAPSSPTNPLADRGSMEDEELDLQFEGDPPNPDPSYPDNAANGLGSGLEEQINFEPRLDDIKIALKFADGIKEASLESKIEPLDEKIIEQIRNPPTHILSIDNLDHCLSLDIFLSVGNASEASYNSIRSALLRRYPESEILTYYKVKQLVANLSGIVPILRDMCINSCVGYTGAFVELVSCPHCGENRYEGVLAKKIPRKQFYTLPLAPQLQALWRAPEGARSMEYRKQCTEEVLRDLQTNAGAKSLLYKDFFNGSDYIEAGEAGISHTQAAELAGAPERGATGASKGINVTMRYMEDQRLPRAGDNLYLAFRRFRPGSYSLCH